MKKILVLLTTLIMIFGFTACGKVTASDQLLTATVSGLNSKKLTIKLEGDIKDYDRTIFYTGMDGGEKFFDIHEKSVKDNCVKYNVVGWQTGTSTFTITLSKDGKVETTIQGYISVLDKLKLTCTSMEVFAEEFVQLTEEQRIEADGRVMFPFRDGQADLLYIKNDGDDYWIPTDYSEDIVKVIYQGQTSEGYDNFFIEPQDEAAFDLLFLNREKAEQFVVSYIFTKNPDTESAKEYVTSIAAFRLEPFDENEYELSKGQEEKIRLISIMDPSFKVPENYVIDNVSYFNYDTGVIADLSQRKIETAKNLPKGYNAVGIDLTKGDVQLEYIKTAATTLKKEIANIESLKQTVSVEELSFGEKTVYYYTLESGYRQALWEADGRVFMIGFIDGDEDGSQSRIILDELLLN